MNSYLSIYPVIYFFQIVNLGKGKSSPSCTTYNCRQLSGKAEFSVDMIEVWAVGPEPTEDDEENVSHFNIYLIVRKRKIFVF